MLVAGGDAWFSVGGQLKKLDRSSFLAAQRRMNAALATVPKGQKPSEEVTDEVNEAKDLQAAAWKWSIPCQAPLEMIKAGDALLLGFNGELHAYSADSGQLLWTQMIDGSVYGIAVAEGRLFVSTDKGEIRAFGRKP